MASAIGRVFKWLGVGVLFLIVGLCLAIVLVPPFLDRIYYRGPVSNHFDGQRFFNPDGEDTLRPPAGRSRGGFLLRYLTGSDDRPEWPEHVAVTPSRPPARVEGQRMLVTWIGHASVLVQTAGLNILTDPVWSETAGPLGFGPRRVAAPGIRFEDLPKIDLVLVSHNHYDHFDLPTLKRLWDRDKPVIVTGLGNDAIMRSRGIESIARDWGAVVPVRGAEVVVTRNHHWDSRWFTDRNRALWSSFVVRMPGGNLFFAGDTGLGDGKWTAEAARYGPIRLALIPIGAFRFEPGQMGIGSHIGPIDATKVFAGLGASHAIGIHWGTFRLSYEAYGTPPRLLHETMRCAGYPVGLFDTVTIGRPIEIPAYAPQPKAQPLGSDCLASPAVRALR
ncbi:MBL fold metallo-hydrolase [Sphingomonas tabacisoli]|uniref:MBL fold metallo-hydrolase n=1 Tax=Sphingomonas tabacisoli TaxID=2249466 RepID=A0ABW4HYW2_9SPHN